MSDIDVVPIRGRYQVQKDGRRRAHPYDRFSAAEAAALRLAEAHPDDVFVITQEVARVARSPLSRSFDR